MKLFALLIAVVLLVPSTSAAQGGLARLVGTVRDQSGAFVPGATVVVRNEKTGEERTVTADANGVIAVSNLKPSTYTVVAKFGEFRPAEYTGMLLQAGQDLSLDLQLMAAGVTESVTVAAAAASLDLSSARMGVNVNQREVEDLPLNGRQM